MQNRRRAVLAVLIGVALAPGLAGCSGNPIENLIHNATGGGVELGGSKVPDGFPTEVPLYDGEVLYGIAVGGDEGGKTYNVTIRVPEGAGEQIQTDLTDAGFTLVGGSDPAGEGEPPTTARTGASSWCSRRTATAGWRTTR
ncbi:hypothetical protein [Naasia aerilata]|uniref:Uncharacterized protein n=1 Tax=Naasia aerilata TaxID=1162966 RepID=A0ABM8G8S9_9MICO|nr:hypothetical protein [Naasia aerilata]BDZ44604.1 hypothetical protein GCM10025866_05130 [Naasia aerilata]